MDELILKLRRELGDAFQRNRTNVLLFSGGIDTGILASMDKQIKAITINFESSGEDIKYATSLAKILGLEHIHKSISAKEAMDSIPEVIKILRSFDPAIPNDIVVYFGLKVVREMGIKEVMTGDGADELFGGYDFMRGEKGLDRYIKRLSTRMVFNSNRLGEYFEIKIKQPFLDREFIDFALKVPGRLKIKKENNKVWGKWILRKAFEDELPKEIIWQDKRPLEIGSGMSKLRDVISSKISNEEFRKKTKFYPVKFINKEHVYFYEIYKKVVGGIPKPKKRQIVCPFCGAGIEIASFHCRICGGVLRCLLDKK